MRKLNLEEFQAISFFDDILIATTTWEEHVMALEGVFSRLNDHRLTARPTKVEIEFNSIEFLGHRVGQGQMRPTESKVGKMLSLPIPTTKKQVRSLLGLIGLNRRYVPNYADVMAPLIDLTKKGKSSRITWTEACQESFQTVKSVLSSSPVVMLPDFSKEFVIRSDASGEGIGAALMQVDGQGGLRPVIFASPRLLDREKRYSTIERECLALVWAIDTFQKYVFGRLFIVETDHRPLTFLSRSRSTNGRLTRWALALQEFSFTVMPIAGTRNLVADLLSRLVS